MRVLKPIRHEIILADNQALTALGIKSLLQNQEIIEARDKRSIHHLVNEQTALIVIDYLSVRDFNVAAVVELRNLYPNIPILVITSDHNKQSIVQVLDSGVSGFLFKDCSQDEITRAVEALLSGDKFFCNKVFEILMQVRQQKAVEDNQPSELTIRELDIIKLVVTGQSTLSIAKELNLSPHTISTHRKNIIKKLKIKSPVELVTYAYDLGLIRAK